MTIGISHCVNEKKTIFGNSRNFAARKQLFKSFCVKYKNSALFRARSQRAKLRSKYRVADRKTTKDIICSSHCIMYFQKNIYSQGGLSQEDRAFNTFELPWIQCSEHSESNVNLQRSWTKVPSGLCIVQMYPYGIGLLLLNYQNCNETICSQKKKMYQN